MLGFGPVGSFPLGGLPAPFVVRPRAGERPIIEVAAFFDAQLIARLKGTPQDLWMMHHRAFEQLVAELWHDLGYEVELTKSSKDGGIDVIAIANKDVKSRYLIQAKRQTPTNKVGIQVARELLGVLHEEDATKAIVVTTSYFTAGAKETFEKNNWRLEGHDFDDVTRWIDRYLSTKDSS